jgi:hypothetical protein
MIFDGRGIWDVGFGMRDSGNGGSDGVGMRMMIPLLSLCCCFLFVSHPAGIIIDGFSSL